MHGALHGSISPREADAMSFDALIEVHRTLDAVDADMARERAALAAEEETRRAELEKPRG
jgi:hypothetical protein